MQPSTLPSIILGVLASLFAPVKSLISRGKDFARTTGENAFGEAPKLRRSPEQIIDGLLALHAPRHPGLHRAGNRRVLRRARHEFFKELAQFAGGRIKNGKEQPALLNRPIRRAISRRLDFAPAR
jgi:hypothetical protein